MKVAAILLFAVVAAGTDVNPISKVIEMIGDLQAKILKEGTAAQKVYEEYAEFCEDRSRELHFEIKTGKENVATLTATISEETALSASLTTKIEELAGSVAKQDKELEEATALRDKEQKDFAAEEKELMDAVDTLGRAIGILEKELAKSGGASMVQIQSANTVAKALNAMVEASMISTSDSTKLTALLQSTQQDGDEDSGAPDPAVYKGQSGGIVEVMQGLFEKAEGQLDELRKKETAAIHNYEMLKQSLEDATAYAKKEKGEAEKDMAESQEKKSDAEGELQATSKDLDADTASLNELHSDCMTKSADFEDETNSRGEELKALATAKKLIVEATSLAQQSQDQDSFLQVSRQTSKAESRNSHVVQIVRDLAKQQKSSALTQLASQLAGMVSFGSRSGEDVFAKVKGLITDMIAKLEAEAEADASKKAYCDKEMAESNAKKDDKEAQAERLSTSIDGMEAKIATLAEEVSTLQKELGEIAAAQSEMDKVRLEEKELFATNKAELEKGIKGITLALKVLTEYYAKDAAHGSAEGAGSSIISMLEVAESDFTKDLAEKTSTEESAIAEYEKETKANEIATASKEKDVEYKTKESKSLKKATAEAKEDLSGVTAELEAVNEYLAKLKEKCFPIPPESYEERVRRREAEVAGLKKALTILEGESVLLETKRSLRRVQRL